jgi:hypothetical protein
VRIVILLAFISQTQVGGSGTIRGRGIGREREVFLEKGSDVLFSLRGGLIAVGACFDLGEDCIDINDWPFLKEWDSIAHTLQTINGPLLKLFKGNLSRRRRVVQI